MGSLKLIKFGDIRIKGPGRVQYGYFSTLHNKLEPTVLPMEIEHLDMASVG